MNRTVSPAYRNDVRRVARKLARVRGVRRSAGGVLAALAVTAGLAVAAPAPEAAAIALPATPTTVVIPATSAAVTAVVPIVTTAVDGPRAVVVLAPTRTGLRQVGAGVSPAGTVSARIRVAAADLQPGSQTWWLRDLTDDTMFPLPVRVVRPTRVEAPALLVDGTTGAVVGAVRVTHRDLVTGRPAPSQSSPVRLERYTGGRWVLVTTWTTDRTGVAYGMTTLPAGIHLLRAVRPAGDTVTSATSPLVRLEVVTGVSERSIPLT